MEIDATTIRQIIAARLRGLPDRASIVEGGRRFTRQGETVLEVNSFGWSRWSLADPRHELDNDGEQFERLWKAAEPFLLSA